MKCLECGAATRIIESRQRQDGTLVRRRECFNLHRFSTREEPLLSRKGADGHSFTKGIHHEDSSP